MMALNVMMTTVRDSAVEKGFKVEYIEETGFKAERDCKLYIKDKPTKWNIILL